MFVTRFIVAYYAAAAQHNIVTQHDSHVDESIEILNLVIVIR